MSDMVATGSKYTDEDRRRAATVYAIKGTLQAVERDTGIPDSTVAGWKNTEWWTSLVENARSIAEDQFRAGCHQIIQKATDETMDRLTNGDTVVTKDGTYIVPVKARDAAVIGAMYYDKLRLSLNLPTSISERSGNQKALDDLADKFKALSNRFANTVIDTQSGQDTKPIND